MQEQILYLQVGGSFSILGGIQTLAGDKSNIEVVCQDEEDPAQCVETFWRIGKIVSLGIRSTGQK